MIGALLDSPRPVPSRLWPAVAGGALILLALPVYAVAGFNLKSWLLAAVVWVAAQVFAIVLAKLPLQAGSLASTAAAGVGSLTRQLLAMLVLFVVATQDKDLALGAILLYAAAFTVELGLTLLTYFGQET